MITTILEILKYTIPGLIVMVSGYLIVQKFLSTQTRMKQLELLHDTQDVTIRLRLQAYERLALFMERIHPRQLVPRIYESSMTVRDLQQMITFNIKTEFQHNLSQQIYVSGKVWDTVRNVKEQEMNMVNNMAQKLKPDAPAKELHLQMVEFLSTMEELPSEIALQIINDEAKLVLSVGSM